MFAPALRFRRPTEKNGAYDAAMRKNGIVGIVVGVALTGAFVAASGLTLAGQGMKAVPRTPDGHPDLQGVWDFAQLTPLERPGAFAGKQTISDEEAEEFAQQRIE